MNALEAQAYGLVDEVLGDTSTVVGIGKLDMKVSTG